MTTVGRNVGDEFIREGVRSFLDDAFGRRYDPYYVCKHDLTTLSRPVLDEIEPLADKFRDADLVIQSGAPVYWANKHSRCYDCPWAESLWKERIFQLGPRKPILNLGAGSGQKDESDLDGLTGDPQVLAFMRAAGQACRWTVVRDALASRALAHAGVPHDLLPCPAFHAARRVNGGRPPEPRGVVAVNLMRLAGHFRMRPEVDADRWRAVVDALLPKLRNRHRLLFVAHDAEEAAFQRTLLAAGEMLFLAPDFRDYVSAYGRVKAYVGNRVHGGVCCAGFGRPSVIIGNDSRLGIARPIGIPAIDAPGATADQIIDALETELSRASEVSDRYLTLRESSAKQYVAGILARVGELQPHAAAA